MIDFLTTGSIPKKYKADQYAREVPGRRFQLRKLKLNIPSLKHLPGFKEQYAIWKEVVTEADIVLYLLRVDQLMAGHKPTEDRVQKDIRQVKKWLDELEEEGNPKKYPLFILGTYCDRTDPDLTALPADQTGSYVNKVRDMPIFQKIELLGGGGSKVRFVFGSLKTPDTTEDLVYQLFYQIRTYKEYKVNMKNLALSFLAQRLDNQDPTHMELNQRPLAEGNVAERQELARQVSEVSIDGSQVFSEESHAAFLLDDKFLLETPSDQLDDAGRIAPIICYGRVPETPPVSWSSDVVKAVVEFAERIGRTVSARSQRIAGSWC